jgi:hypothetical protein
MTRKLFHCLYIILIPALAFTQPPSSKDSADDVTIKNVCDNKIFDRVEVPSDFKFGKNAVEDQIARYFRDAGLPIPNGKVSCILIITSDARVIRVRKLKGEYENEKALGEALELTTGLWTIALQNSHPVCNYVRLEIEFTENSVNVKKTRF